MNYWTIYEVDVATTEAKAKDERIDFRTTEQVKQVIQRAADLLGTTMSAFIAQKAYQAAQEVLAGHADLELSNRDRDRFLALLDNAAEPNAALRSLLQDE